MGRGGDGRGLSASGVCVQVRRGPASSDIGLMSAEQRLCASGGPLSPMRSTGWFRRPSTEHISADQRAAQPGSEIFFRRQCNVL